MTVDSLSFRQFYTLQHGDKLSDGQEAAADNMGLLLYRLTKVIEQQ